MHNSVYYKRMKRSESIKENEPQTIDQSETIEDMNITITELNEKIQDQEDKINKFKTTIDAIIKQHANVINKLTLAVYNIDESIYEQIFNNQQQDNDKENTNEMKYEA